ncbi:MAG: hypothetical protein KJ601_07130 [Nanoarchaeota archaeon]|nr:hypothetical protein [Nanoarchaeota archaeon]MBU1704154.1 hypothetical protein [Nanoarchaeota archaeon]
MKIKFHLDQDIRMLKDKEEKIYYSLNSIIDNLRIVSGMLSRRNMVEADLRKRLKAIEVSTTDPNIQKRAHVEQAVDSSYTEHDYLQDAFAFILHTVAEVKEAIGITRDAKEITDECRINLRQIAEKIDALAVRDRDIRARKMIERNIEVIRRGL